MDKEKEAISIKNDEVEKKEVRFELISLVSLGILSMILIKPDSDFYSYQAITALLINCVTFTLVYIFFKSLKLSSFLHKTMLVLVLIWLCVLPIIFYRVYSNDISAFTYDSKYLNSLKSLNEKDFSLNEKNIVENKKILVSELRTSIYNKKLPNNSDTLILSNNFIIYALIKSRDSDNDIKFYNKNSGKFLFSFDKKSTISESYNYFEKNLKFKFNKVKSPEIGITYFDFWCSSIISFKDNLIKPLRNWILALNFIYILIFLTPIFKYAKDKILQSKTKE